LPDRKKDAISLLLVLFDEVSVDPTPTRTTSHTRREQVREQTGQRWLTATLK
jgi:hypothetical protein